MNNPLDVIVFGATGFTGKLVVQRLYKLDNVTKESITWGIAGRSENKLKNLLIEIAQKIDVEVRSVPIIVADVTDEESVKSMTARARIMINCCGPYELYGDVVVKSCIETGTNYLDISGEMQFAQRIVAKYNKAAEERGIYIISGCGLDVLVTDLNVACLEKNFKGTLNTVDIYADDCTEERFNSVARLTDGTWKSYVCFLKDMAGYIFRKNIQPLPKQQSNCLVSLFPCKNIPERGIKWTLQLPFVDSDVLIPSQRYFYEHDGKWPIQARISIIKNSFFQIFKLFSTSVVIMMLCQFQYGRNLLLKYPEFFTYGYFSHIGPNEDEEKNIRYSCTFHGKGWSEEIANNKDKCKPNKEIVGYVNMTSPIYGFSSMSVILCAVMILNQRNKLPVKGGVYYPAAAFRNTTLVEELEKNGFVLKILSIKDI